MAQMKYTPGTMEFYAPDTFDRVGELSYCTIADSISGTTLGASSDYAVYKGDIGCMSFSADVADFKHELDNVIGRVAALEGGCARSCAAETISFKSAWRYNRRAFKTLAN